MSTRNFGFCTQLRPHQSEVDIARDPWCFTRSLLMIVVVQSPIRLLMDIITQIIETQHIVQN